ncbi:S-adenosyl-methyltransferase MraW [Candidatus Magnetoovum chiemensis]|nr:S-adenosyl-methyltransferase MraW [Candidatus Magnetoovum chiemensis]
MEDTIKTENTIKAEDTASSQEIIHEPVLVQEVAAMLEIKANGVYVDATAGTGGHCAFMLKALGAEGRLIAIDKDGDVLAICKKRLSSDSRVSFINDDFTNITAIVKDLSCGEVDGILIDLGMSMYQVKSFNRGFSFNSTSRLDMRMDRNAEITAWNVVNKYTKERLESIIRDYSDEFKYRRIADAIVKTRQSKTIDTCNELADLIASVYGKRGKTHPATKTFQALRVYVNDEINKIPAVLEKSKSVLKTGGRVCVISYHSIEDRAVKQFFAREKKEGRFALISKKPISAQYDEIKKNSSARSAKLRGAVKL